MTDRRRVVIVNGPAGVGKTTVGRRLAATAQNGICIHGDDLKNFVINREPGTVPNGMTYVAAAVLTDLYLDAGYELVVFEFIFNSAVHVARFTDALTIPAPLLLLTLWAPLHTVEARERCRVGRDPLGPRVTECWSEMPANLGELGTIVDATPPVDRVVRAATELVFSR